MIVGVPGAGTYDPTLTSTGPKYSITTAQRFSSFAQKTATHTFYKPLSYEKASYIFGKDSRFKYKQEKEKLRSRAPGPGAYNSFSSFKTAEKMRNGE